MTTYKATDSEIPLGFYMLTPYVQQGTTITLMADRRVELLPGRCYRSYDGRGPIQSLDDESHRYFTLEGPFPRREDLLPDR